MSITPNDICVHFFRQIHKANAAMQSQNCIQNEKKAETKPDPRRIARRILPSSNGAEQIKNRFSTDNLSARLFFMPFSPDSLFPFPFFTFFSRAGTVCPVNMQIFPQPPHSLRFLISAKTRLPSFTNTPVRKNTVLRMLTEKPLVSSPLRPAPGIPGGK